MKTKNQVYFAAFSLETQKKSANTKRSEKKVNLMIHMIFTPQVQT